MAGASVRVEPPTVVACLACRWVHAVPWTCAALAGRTRPAFRKDERDPWNRTTPGVTDYVDAYGDNQSMNDAQFNPLLRENVPPVLVEATAETFEVTEPCWVGIRSSEP